jgi:hypothetical protein
MPITDRLPTMAGWPMMFFMVVKSPAEGHTHIFRPNEPFVQFTVIPADSDFELIEMSEEESAGEYDGEFRRSSYFNNHRDMPRDSSPQAIMCSVLPAMSKKQLGGGRTHS